MRVVSAEDLFLLRDGLVRLAEAHGHTVAAAVGTGPAALDALLTERERSVLALMAEGLSNAAIASRLFLSEGAISEGAISKYTTTIFAKLGLAADDDTNRTRMKPGLLCPRETGRLAVSWKH